MYFEEPRTVRAQKTSPAVMYTLIGAAIAVVLFFFLSWPIIDYAKDSLPTLVTTLVSGAK